MVELATAKRAIIVGVTGIQGGALAGHLKDLGWEVLGLARRPTSDVPGVTPIAADLTDPASVRQALDGIDPTHVFFTAWSRQATEAENRLVNGGMLRNLLEAVANAPSLQHVALTTGLKHYLGPFEAYALSKPDTPFREEQERLPYENFYYDQEDILWEFAADDAFTWSVHRPHTVIGWAIGNAMNMGVTLAVYAAIARETERPFVFPGSPEQYNAVTDVTDARILARHLEWAAVTPEASNEAFNIVNGDQFRWRRMWGIVADGLGVEAAEYPGQPDAAGRADGRRCSGVGSDRRKARPGPTSPRGTCFVVAQRRRPGPDDRDVHRHDQEPRTRFHRLPADRPILSRPL